MDYSERRGSFVVGAYPDLVTHHLPPGIQSFSKNYPDVRIQLLARPYTPLLRLVRSGEVDLAFCGRPPADDQSLDFQELFQYDIVLMTPLGHPLLEQGVAVCGDFTLHQRDHDRLGVVRLDHIFDSSVIGVCTLKGKFLGHAVRRFIDVLSDEMRGFHADLAGLDHPNVRKQRKAKSR